MYDPQKVIVYRSQSEAMMDQFWWSQGWLTPTKAGDAIILAILGVVAFLAGLAIYNHFRWGRYKGHLSTSKLVACFIGLLLSTPPFFLLAYHFLD